MKNTLYKLGKYLHQRNCNHENKKETEFYPYPPDMYVEDTCMDCGKKFYQDIL